MPIETLDDIVEQIADWCRVYGAHDHNILDECQCRVCFTGPLKSRIRQAVEIERRLEVEGKP